MIVNIKILMNNIFIYYKKIIEKLVEMANKFAYHLIHSCWWIFLILWMTEIANIFYSKYKMIYSYNYRKIYNIIEYKEILFFLTDMEYQFIYINNIWQNFLEWFIYVYLSKREKNIFLLFLYVCMPSTLLTLKNMLTFYYFIKETMKSYTWTIFSNNSMSTCEKYSRSQWFFLKWIPSFVHITSLRPSTYMSKYNIVLKYYCKYSICYMSISKLITFSIHRVPIIIEAIRVSTKIIIFSIDY